MSDDALMPKKRKRTGKKSKKISFDEEIVPKDLAQIKIKSQVQDDLKDKLDSASGTSKSKRQKLKPVDTSQASKESKKPKRKKKTENELNNKEAENPSGVDTNVNSGLDEQLELDPANPTIQKEESKRAKKRKKHQQLLLEKKVKVDLVMQEKSLNYLSRWKHNRDEWKFEKLRQVWLQQNIFDSDRIPDQFWETLVEYFSNAQGKIRQTLIDDAVKIIEKSENEVVQTDVDEESADDAKKSQLNKIQRAKDIIQNLQE